ncbi:MAG: transcriptional repressor LexA [Christensenellales bacterium]|jgi:repressor LexA|nr:transcriptional repressor LexA [Christensenellaceae bacterium]
MSSTHGRTKRKRGETREIILQYIKQHVSEKGYPPSVREICAAVGLKSTSTVHGHLKRLEESGELRRDAMKPRAMELINPDNLDSSSLVSIPLLGPIAAGSPILAEENYTDQIELPSFMLTKGEHFALKVRGDSMKDVGIMHGDTIIVHKQNTANNGDIVVALIQGDATVKRFFKENGHFRLQPENSTMAPIYTPVVEVLGKVVSVFRVL